MFPTHNRITVQLIFTLKRINPRIIAFGLGFLFLVLTTTVHFRVWQAIDWITLTGLQNVLPRPLDLPFSIFSLLGSAEVSAFVFLIVVFFARTENRLPLIFSFGAATAIELIGKRFVNQPTTPDELLRYIPLAPILSNEINPGFSFPSGHALRTTFIVLVLASLIASRQLTRPTKIAVYIGLIFIELVMLISRVYLAEHWLTDVIGGAMLGGAFALIALQWQINLPNTCGRK
jgi:membrane-associated phospholipid phosphatase